MGGTTRKLLVASAAAIAMVGAVAGPAAAAPGHLDASFGGDGQVATTFPAGGAYAYATMVLNNGKIVAAGDAYHTQDDVEWAVARYQPNGTLDPTFGTGGKVTTNLSGGFDSAYAIARGPSGTFYVGGYSGSTFAVARYLPDGHLDHSFSGDGKALVPFALGPAFGYDMAIAPGGKVVLAGEVDSGGVGRYAVVRLTDAGALDHTFSGDGRATVDLGPNSYVDAVTVLGDGSIVVAGDAHTTSNTSPGLVKLLPSGSPDPSFGSGGIEVDDVGQDFSARDILHLPSGKLLVEGSYRTGPATFDIGLMRYQSNGHPDAAFGPGGLLTRNFGGTTEYPDRALRAGKRVLIATAHYDGAVGHLGVVRLTMNGAADTGFGDNGLALAAANASYGDAVAVGTDGRIVVGGSAGILDAKSRFFLARFLVA